VDGRLVARSVFCPNCGAETIGQFPANRKLADLECRTCFEEYALKAPKQPFGARIIDGEYGTKLKRLRAANNPSLMVLRTDKARMSVTDLIVVPKHFFTLEMVEARTPLGPDPHPLAFASRLSRYGRGRSGLAGRIRKSGSMPCRLMGGSRWFATAISCQRPWCWSTSRRLVPAKGLQG
jgi:hypothetical protein